MSLKSNWVDGDQYTPAAANAVGNAINAIVDGATTTTVTTAESTTSTTYTDLPTTTDSVTVTIGSSGKALVLIGSSIYSGNSAGNSGWVGYAMSGANTSSAGDAKAISAFSSAASGIDSRGGAFLETGLIPGSTTFKLKYKSSNSGATFTFQNRRITVIPFP